MPIGPRWTPLPLYRQSYLRTTVIIDINSIIFGVNHRRRISVALLLIYSGIVGFFLPE